MLHYIIDSIVIGIGNSLRVPKLHVKDKGIKLAVCKTTFAVVAHCLYNFTLLK